MSWVPLLYMLCTMFIGFKQGISSSCYYSILTRNPKFFSPATFNSTKTSNWLPLLVFYSLLFYCQFQEKSKTICQTTKTNSYQNPLQKTCSYLEKMTFGRANSILILFMVYCLKHSIGIFCMPGDVAAVGNTEMNKIQAWPWQLVFHSVFFTPRFPVL